VTSRVRWDDAARLPDDDRDGRLDAELAVGRAVLRLIELAWRDDSLRRGLEVLADAILAPATTAAPAPIRPETAGAMQVPPDMQTPAVTQAAPSVHPPETAPPHETTPVPEASPSPGEQPTETVPGPRDEVVRRPRRDEVEPMRPEAFLALLQDVVRGLDRDDRGTLAEALLPPVADEVAEAPLGRQRPDQASVASRERDEALRDVVARARLKAQVARAAADRVRTGEPVDEDLVHRARSEGASLWMLDLTEPDPARLDTLAEAFDALSEAAELVLLLGQAAPDDRPRRMDAVRHVAAVQSALRVATRALRITEDEDQRATFAWLDATTSGERIYVARHMRLDDPLDPAHLSDVMSEVHAELDVLRAQSEREEAERDRFKQIRYHAGRIAKGKGSDHDADKIVEAVTELVELGLPPSNLELRELLLPIADRLPPPDGHSREYARVLADLEAARSRPASGRPRGVPAAKPRSAEVERVRDLLQGTEMVLVGGERRVEHEREIREAFGLADVHWFTLGQDPSHEELERAIARPAVSVVLQLIRWSRHRFGEVAAFADSEGKPFVRVPGGYSVNALAHAISEQASERLVARPPTAADGAQ